MGTDVQLPTKEGIANHHPFRRFKSTLPGDSFSIENSEWVEARDLSKGDQVYSADGSLLVVESVIIDQREETVYNFEVEDFHTYFVGEDGVWVHNDAGYNLGTLTRKEEYLTGGGGAGGPGLILTILAMFGQYQDKKLQDAPGRDTSVSEKDATDMRRQGLDPFNKDDVKKYKDKADVKKDELRKHIHRNIKDTDAINDINRFLGSGIQTDINPFTGKKELDRIFSLQQDGSVRSVRIGNHETRNPNNQHYHLENWDKNGKFIKPDESVKINRTGNN